VVRLLRRLLCAVLMVWQPMNFAAAVSMTLPTMSFRGPLAAFELMAHGLVAALSASAGWALWHSRPHGPNLAILALSAMAGVSVQSLYWSTLPSQVQPGTEFPLALLALAHATFWIGFLFKTSHCFTASHREDELSNHIA
jgi:hypothetical protein